MVTEYERAKSRRSYLKNRDEVLRRSRERYLANRETLIAQNKAYRELHPEVAQKAWRKYQKSNRAKCRERNRNWYFRNLESQRLRSRIKIRKYYAENKEMVLAKGKQWRQRHKQVILANSAKRRALKKGATLNLAKIKEWMASVKARRFVACYYCDTPTRTTDIHFDHIIALSKGGAHSVDNLCVSCARCNLSKKAKTIDAWVRIGQQVLAL